jgi:predicted nucleic-acid-binding protein
LCLKERQNDLLDSNVIIRIITGDSPKVANDLLELIETSAKNEFYITSAVLVEVCFVLEFHDYKMDRKDIYAALKRLLAAPQMSASKYTVSALELYKQHIKLDFTDCYLVAKAKDNNAKVLTLDKALLKIV